MRIDPFRSGWTIHPYNGGDCVVGWKTEWIFRQVTAAHPLLEADRYAIGHQDSRVGLLGVAYGMHS